MRHGETESNRLSIVQGHNSTPLAETGIHQAQTTAKAIARIPFSHIYCSDLVRTRQTVEPLIALRGEDTVVYDPRLREKGAGVAEGIKLAALHKLQKDSGQSVRTYKPEGGESWDEVRARANSFFQLLLQLMRQGVRGPVLVVTHGGAYRSRSCHKCFASQFETRFYNGDGEYCKHCIARARRVLTRAHALLL
jgi:broad specificity phosphatase PhoE